MRMSKIRTIGPIALATLFTAFSATSVHASSFGAFALASASGVCTDGSDSVSVSEPTSASALAFFAGTVMPGCALSYLTEGNSLSAVAEARGSLVTGHLQAWASALGLDLAPSPTVMAVATGAGQARIFDHITIDGPIPVFSITAGLRFHVEGTLEGLASANAIMGLFPSPAFPLGRSADNCVGTLLSLCRNFGTGPFEFDVALDVPVSSLDPSFTLFAALSASAVNSGTADVLGSGQLRIELPPGFTFRSDSGVLLSEPAGDVGAVPEPGTVVLVGTGVAAAVCRRRARRAR